MNIELAILQFSNLLAIANISALKGNGYEKQEELILEFRKRKQPFLATMPMRHRYRCELCGFEQGESIFHFENPNIPANEVNKEITWCNPDGMWAQSQTGELHRILAHGEESPKQLLQVLSSVNC
jgi:hypothetical protein